MLRITPAERDNSAVVLRLDGKVTGTCVAALEEQCMIYKNRDGMTVVLDFSGVSYIDAEGVRMLESINDDRLEIVNCPLFIETLLEKLINSKKGE